nr:hypothetical protein [uncultured Desulfobacter sp.]
MSKNKLFVHIREDISLSLCNFFFAGAGHILASRYRNRAKVTKRTVVTDDRAASALQESIIPGAGTVLLVQGKTPGFFRSRFRDSQGNTDYPCGGQSRENRNFKIPPRIFKREKIPGGGPL